MKKSLSVLLTIVMSVSLLAFPVYAYENRDEATEQQNTAVIQRELHNGQTQSIAPFWLSTSQVIHGVVIGSGGNSTVSVAFYTYSGTDRIEVTATLQKLNGSSWSYVDDWSTSGTGAAYISESCTVSRGTYRVKTVGKVYDKNGKYIETVTVYSTSKSY